MYYLYEDNYSYICAICMFKSRTLLEVTPKRRFLLEAIVSMENHTELAEYVRTSHLMLCNDCSRLVNTMLKFQQTVVRGLTNLIVLRKLSDERSQTSHNLPEVINADTDLLLPVVNEEIVSTADSPPPVFQPVVGKNARGLKNCKVVSLNELRNLKISELINVSNQINSPKYRPPILKKEPKKQRELKKKAKPEEDVDRCCDSDFCLSCNPQNVPGCQLLVTKSQMDHEYSSTNTNEMAVLLPINNAIEKHESTNTIQSSEVKKTKLNRQLYQAIQLALKSRSITDFDIDQYEPESKSDFEHELDDIPNTKNHQNHSNSTLDDLLDASKSPDHDSNSSHTKSCPDSEVTLSCESDYGGHDSKSSHDGSKSCFDSEMTLSCESDYEDAENFPNIMLAKAFRDVECRVEDGEKNVHVVWDPPSEWPCSVECCPLTEDGSSSDEVPEIPEADDKPKTNVSQWRRIECKLCGKKFVSLYRLFEHYEREHMELSRKECSNGTALKNDNTKHLPKVPHLALQKLQHSPYSCAECGTDCRTKTQLALHLVTLRHKLRSQWRFQCDACKRKFLDKEGVAEHIQREHLAKQANKCPLCEATFHSARAFVKHAATHIVDTQTDTSTQETRKPRARKGTDTSESTGASHSARAVLKHTAHAPATRKPRANMQATRKRRSRTQATRKPRARKGTDIGTTPVPQNVLETANVTTEALNGRKLIDTEETTIPNGPTKRTRKIQSTRPRKQTRKTHANGARKARKRRNQLVQDWDTYSKAQETLKRTKLTHPRKKLAQNYNTNMDMQGTQQRKYFADNCDIYSNLQYTQFHKQLAHNADTYTNAQTYPRKECEHNYGIYTYAQDTQLLNTPKYTHDMQDTQNEEHAYSQRTTQVRKRTQTVAELRKMLKRKLETRIEDDVQRHTYFAGEPDSYHPPNNGPVKKYFINK